MTTCENWFFIFVHLVLKSANGSHMFVILGSFGIIWVLIFVISQYFIIGWEVDIWQLVRKNCSNIASNGVSSNCIFQAWMAFSMVVDEFGFGIAGKVLEVRLLNVSMEVDIGLHRKITLQIRSHFTCIHWITVIISKSILLLIIGFISLSTWHWRLQLRLFKSFSPILRRGFADFIEIIVGLRIPLLGHAIRSSIGVSSRLLLL